ncbi:MAG: hypothetical protein IJG50_08165 [Clostridia bacterium]|nr:hypothetical protein [Clostridia bacterium]
MDYNYNALRFDIMYMLDGLYNQGFPGALEAYNMAEKASNEELLKIAEDMEFDLNDYPVPRREDLWLPENKKLKRYRED